MVFFLGFLLTLLRNLYFLQTLDTILFLYPRPTAFVKSSPIRPVRNNQVRHLGEKAVRKKNLPKHRWEDHIPPDK